MVLSFLYAFSDPLMSVIFYFVAFSGDALDGHVARMFNQSNSEVLNVSMSCVINFDVMIGMLKVLF